MPQYFQYGSSLKLAWNENPRYRFLNTCYWSYFKWFIMQLLHYLFLFWDDRLLFGGDNQQLQFFFFLIIHHTLMYVTIWKIVSAATSVSSRLAAQTQTFILCAQCYTVIRPFKPDMRWKLKQNKSTQGSQDVFLEDLLFFFTLTENMWFHVGEKCRKKYWQTARLPSGFTQKMFS